MNCISFNQELFTKDFLKGKDKSFQHKTNNVFKLFPYTGSTSDKGLDSFDTIIGAFIRALYNTQEPKKLERDKIIQEALRRVAVDNSDGENELEKIIKTVYFDDNGYLKCDSLQTYEYSKNKNNENKIAAFLVSVLCDRERIIPLINQSKEKNSNLLDQIIVESLPKLNDDNQRSKYYNMDPTIKDLFTDDICFLLEQPAFNSNEILDLLSYYYFYYVSQSLLKLDERLNESDTSKEEIYYCLAWEKTSKNRKCYNYGWRKIERHLDSMFSHAVLLDMLNHFNFGKLCCYDEIFKLYQDSDEGMRKVLYNQILDLKRKYENEYVKEGNLLFESELEYGDLAGLIRAFHGNVKKQFLNTVRKRANEAYQKSFTDFSRNNFLQNRKRNGLMLALDEERIILLTKVVLKNDNHMKLNDLLKGFEQRGVYFDNPSKEALITFYDALGLIEKKSDSGDAKYVKGIL